MNLRKKVNQYKNSQTGEGISITQKGGGLMKFANISISEGKENEIKMPKSIMLVFFKERKRKKGNKKRKD